MKPFRMCAVCRARKEKDALIRIACQKGKPPVIDTEGTKPGRGVYVCAEETCISQAQKRRILERAISAAVDANVYQQLKQLLKEDGYES